MPPENAIVLTITLDAAGNVGVNGPIDNKVLCMGMIEVAKGAILAHKGEKQLIQQVPPGARVVTPFRG